MPAAWQLHVVFDGTRYFEAPEIPAQLVLDEDDTVRKVKPQPQRKLPPLLTTRRHGSFV